MFAYECFLNTIIIFFLFRSYKSQKRENNSRQIVFVPIKLIMLTFVLCGFWMLILDEFDKNTSVYKTFSPEIDFNT